MIFAGLLSLWFVTGNAESAKQWENPFHDLLQAEPSVDSLTLKQALALVNGYNRSLQANQWRLESAAGMVTQAGLAPNPELAMLAEDISGNLPGMQESEISVELSQELELWGKRSWRRRLAQKESQRVTWETQVVTFDLYAETKRRYYRLLHAQKRLQLAKTATGLIQQVIQAARHRVEQGAAHPSEVLLGELELAQAKMIVTEAETELEIARRELTALWAGESAPPALGEIFLPDTLPPETSLEKFVDYSRPMTPVLLAQETAETELSLAQAEGKANVTLVGGYKRLQLDKANTFVVGVELPLNLFNRNQGASAAFRARVREIELEQEQTRIEALVRLQAVYRKLQQYLRQYKIMETSVLPKAEETFQSLKKAYELGRMSYLNLLEAQRNLVEVGFELNDLRLETALQVIELEQLIGLPLEDMQ
jgi:cobalt-zinc-cadmium efflux system outer membrane protein